MSDSCARPLRIVLLGPPASGKGTQGRLLAENLGLGYLSTGALLREQVESRSELGKLAEPILERGGYLPDDLMCRILADWLGRQSCGWVLDGFPRSLPQADFLNEWLDAHDQSVTCAVSLEVPYEQLVSRIRHRVECPDCRWSGQADSSKHCPACGAQVSPRADDSEENFNNRYQEFRRLTGPVIARYQEAGKLINFDATAPQDEVGNLLLRHFQS